MTMGNRIAQMRKKQGLTQETLAKMLDVTNQAVSKWESDQCCPDITLLPRIADIFGISIDELFGRAPLRVCSELPWDEDGVLRAVLFVGQELVEHHPAAERIEFFYEGPVLNIQSQFSVTCDDVTGNVHAGGHVDCDDVFGHVQAGGYVNCDDIEGNVTCGGNVSCDEIGGSVTARGSVSCDEIGGSVNVRGNVTCTGRADCDGDCLQCPCPQKCHP